MGEDITATRSFSNMKISILIASLALIYATASPIDNVVPEESLSDNEYIHPDDEAHATAQRKVNELLQSGKSDADCRKLAKSTADDVIKSVAAQQAALNKMGRGSQCNVEGSSLIAAAEKSKSTAESNLKSKTTAHTNAKAKKFNFGDFSYNTLTEGQCGTFFNSAVWKSAKASVAAAKSAMDKAQGAVAQAKKDLADAKATAAKMVATCKCNVKKLHAKTITDFNSSVNAANMKAWKLAAHLVCVLDHKTTNQCTVPTLPTVKAVTLDAGVSTACAPTFVKTAGQNCAAAGFKDIMNLKECIKARNQLGFAQHKSAISDNTMTNRPHGCTVSTVSNQNGLIRLYHKGTQACNTQYQNFCLCTKR